MKKNFIAFFTILMLNVVSCTIPGKMTPIWHENDNQIHSIHKVLVVALAKDTLIQKGTEYHVVKELKDDGIEAFSTTRFEKPGQKLSPDKLEQLFQENSIDGILAIRRVDTDSPSREETNQKKTPNDTEMNFFDFYNLTNSSEYIIRAKAVNIECNLYSASDKKLLWSGEFEIKNPKKLSDIVDPLGKMIAKNLSKEGYLVEK